jgi:cell division protein YceG involved in septum cleavage
MSIWTNDDGLRITTGVDEATQAKAGEYRLAGNMHMVETEFTATSLATGAAVLDYNTVFPNGARIEKVEVVAETACTSGGSAVLNVGFIRTDLSTELDYDGLVAALALTSIDADGDVVTLIQGSTGHGALVGTTLAYDGYLTADYDTAAFTAGKLLVRVYFYMP